jgi:chemotaxis signal transduction protein
MSKGLLVDAIAESDPIARGKPFFTGIVNVRGRLMAILDLAAFFGQNSLLIEA